MSLNLKKTDPSKAAEAGYWFTIVLPDGTETDAKIKVRGANSPVVRQFGRKVYNEHQIRVNAARKKGKTELDDMSIEEAEQFAARAAAVRVMDWSGLTNDEADDKVPFPFSKENAETLMLDYFYLREQVMEASNEVLNFPC